MGAELHAPPTEAISRVTLRQEGPPTSGTNQANCRPTLRVAALVRDVLCEEHQTVRMTSRPATYAPGAALSTYLKKRDFAATTEPRGGARRGPVSVRNPKPGLANIAGAVPGPLPRFLEPQLATLVDRPPAGDGYIHELKFDGYRVLARMEGEKVQLFSRGGLDWTERVPELEAAMACLPAKAALLDGELVALDGRGVSDFQTLQNSLHQLKRPALYYYAFDILHLDGVDLRNCTLLERKAILKKLLAQAPTRSTDHIRLSEHVFGGGAKFLAEAGKQELEGIISKRADSPYRSGRTQDWLKVKCLKRQEFVIVGYTQPKGGRSSLGALLLGLWQGSELVYAGRVGTGFSASSLRVLHSRLISISLTESPVKHSLPRASVRGVTWVEPKLVAEVAFTGFTKDGLLRHPSFVGLRDDKDPNSVALETATEVVEKPSGATDAKKIASGFPITHPTKVLYPELGITKRELLEYYALVAERMLPHIANRPLTLVRCPNGQGRPCFFQKHLGGSIPAGIREVVDTEGAEPYAALDSIEGLLGLVQLGALEIHTWGSRADDLERPDILVFDLDPDPEVEFRMVVEAAKELRGIFAAASLQSFVKTTGGKGLHVCIPIEPDLHWNEAKAFCREVADALVKQSPNRYVATASKEKRKGRIFIDYLRNGRGATFVAPYSTRAHANATVATPLDWDELTPKLKPQFDVRNLKHRLSERPEDQFLALATLKQKLPKGL